MYNFNKVNETIAKKVFNYTGDSANANKLHCHGGCGYYATSMEYAGKVLDKMAERCEQIRITICSSRDYFVEVNYRPPYERSANYYDATAETMPMAICLAVLSSYGIDLNTLLEDNDD